MLKTSSNVTPVFSLQSLWYRQEELRIFVLEKFKYLIILVISAGKEYHLSDGLAAIPDRCHKGATDKSSNDLFLFFLWIIYFYQFGVLLTEGNFEQL